MNAIIGVKQGYYKQFPYKTKEDLQIQPNQICYNKYTNADGSIVGLMVIPDGDDRLLDLSKSL